MTKEEKFVVYPLYKWFKEQKAGWKLYKPKYGTSATGWDIEAQRKNKDLLIEAKFIDSAFLASFTGMVTASLANRPQHFMKRKYRGWSHGICWAIGTSYPQRNIYQLLFDYLVRNLHFWKHYAADLKMNYVFFVVNGVVTRIKFDKILLLAKLYKTKTNRKNLAERRNVAEKLMTKK